MARERTTDAATAAAWAHDLLGPASAAAFLIAPARFEVAERDAGSLSLTLLDERLFGVGFGPRPPLHDHWAACAISDSTFGDHVGRLARVDEWDFYTRPTSPGGGPVTEIHDDVAVESLLRAHADWRARWCAGSSPTCTPEKWRGWAWAWDTRIWWLSGSTVTPGSRLARPSRSTRRPVGVTDPESPARGQVEEELLEGAHLRHEFRVRRGESLVVEVDPRHGGRSQRHLEGRQPGPRLGVGEELLAPRHLGELGVGRDLALAPERGHRVVGVAAGVDRRAQRRVPLVVGVALGHDDAGEGLARERASPLVESHLDAAVAASHEEPVAPRHHWSCSIVLCRPATWSFTQ